MCCGGGVPVQVEGGQGRLFFLDGIYEVPYGGAT